MIAIGAYTAYAVCMQYTIRKLPARLDKLIRKRAKEEGKSLNTVGTEGRANERFLQRFLAKDGVEVAYATDATTHHYASLFRQLRQQGTPVPTNDLWIAALVTEHGASLCTRDAHFGKLAQLDVV